MGKPIKVIPEERFAIPMEMAEDIARDTLQQLYEQGKISFIAATTQDEKWAGVQGGDWVAESPHIVNGIEDYYKKIVNPSYYGITGGKGTDAQEKYVIVRDAFRHAVNYVEAHPHAVGHASLEGLAAQLRASGFADMALAEAYRRMGVAPPEKSME